jgi:hypothetical protein
MGIIGSSGYWRIKTPFTWYGVFRTGLSVITLTTTDFIFGKVLLIILKNYPGVY